MRTVHRLVVQAVKVCAEHDTGVEEWRKGMQHDRGFRYVGEKNEQKQKSVWCSARVKQNQHVKVHTVIVFF